MKIFHTLWYILAERVGLRASMYAERGVGEYGIRFSHFCGPIISGNTMMLDHGPFFQIYFGMNFAHLRTSDFVAVAGDETRYHILRGSPEGDSMSAEQV